jgi:hypothetical protein
MASEDKYQTYSPGVDIDDTKYPMAGPKTNDPKYPASVSSTDVEAVRSGEAERLTAMVMDPQAERRLCRRFDTR